VLLYVDFTAPVEVGLWDLRRLIVICALAVHRIIFFMFDRAFGERHPFLRTLVRQSKGPLALALVAVKSWRSTASRRQDRRDRRARPACNRPRRLDFIHRWWHERASLPNSIGEPMKTFFLRFFTWWNGATFGTLLTTSLYGEFVGEDEFGNRYYRTKGGKIDPALGFERRWVIYNGVVEASSVPPSWHGWMHHTVDVPPTQETVVPRPWWKPHRPNLTGTPGAHRPTGSTLAQGRRPKATGDYKAWIPGR